MVDNKKFNFITNFVFGCKITNYFQLTKYYANMYILLILAYSDNYISTPCDLS